MKGLKPLRSGKTSSNDTIYIQRPAKDDQKRSPLSVEAEAEGKSGGGELGRRRRMGRRRRRGRKNILAGERGRRNV